jgi:hypothetical protein
MSTLQIIQQVAAIVGDVSVLATAIGGLLGLLGAARAASIFKAIGIDLSQFISGITGKPEKVSASLPAPSPVKP